ncbi:MAG TPA: hypothetical protein VJP02_25695 [Candidatus Sulfotelmatobacter sp.]|nr:hypothetical protein [Candidatus Sulfotelmatobacter sp.]
MDPKFQSILNALPVNEPRSRLEPYRELILEMRKRERSYREIAHVLKQSCGLRVGMSTINDFVLARTKSTSKHKRTATKDLSVTNKHSVALRSTYNDRKDIQGVVSTQKALEDTRRNIKVVKDKPPINNKKKPVFEYNPDEPLRLQRNQKTKE